MINLYKAPVPANPENKIYWGNCVELLKNLPDRSVDLIILDPPYWKVVNQKWDYQWRTMEDYKAWCSEWIKEISRVIKYSGSIYLFGYVRNLIPLYDILETNNFMYRQSITVDKGLRSIAGRRTSTYKMFPTTTEEIWFFKYDTSQFIKDYLKEQQKKSGLTNLEINHALGMKTNGGGLWSIYTGNNIIKQTPSETSWNRLKNLFQFDLEHSEISQVFNIEKGITNVWTDIDFYKEKKIHPTQKPIELIERLIKASTNENMVVLDPFAGSGSTAIACNNLNRRYILMEQDKKYIKKLTGRLRAQENITIA